IGLELLLQVDHDLFEDLFEGGTAVLAHATELALDAGDVVVRALQELDVHQRFFHGRRLRETEAGAFSIGRIRGPYLIVARTVRRTTEPRRVSRADAFESRFSEQPLSTALPFERLPNRTRSESLGNRRATYLKQVAIERAEVYPNESTEYTDDNQN